MTVRILSLGAHGVVEEVLVGEADAVGEFGAVGPAEFCGFRYVEELAGGTVGFGGVPFDCALVADGLCDEFSEFLDGELFAGASVDGLVAGVIVHQKDAERREVIDIEKLAQGTAVAPAHHFRFAGFLGFVKAADEGGEDVGMGGMIVVVGTVEVGRHYGDVVCAVLTVEELAVFETGDFGECVGLVGLFKFGCQQTALGHGLWSHAGIDAGRAEEFEFLAAVAPCGVDDVHFEHHVVVHEVGER